MSDIRFVLRVLARSPGFTITVLLALAVGIGATTAIFSLVNGVLLRPLPYQAPDRLVMVWQDVTARGGPVDEWASPGNIRDWRRQRDLFASVSAITGWNASVAFDGAPEALRGEQVSHDYFATLGLEPAAGRWFDAREDLPGAPRAVILSHGLWQSRFGADRAVIGRRLSIGAEPHEVVGVAPPDARGVLVADSALWRPLRLDLATPTYGSIFLRAIGRLAPGVTLDAARARMPGLAASLQAQSPELRQASINLQPAHAWIVGDARRPLLVLLAAVLTLLLLTVANVANLLLARASAREREMSIRAAIGAGRVDLVRLMILESLVLSLGGGALGIAAAGLGLEGLLALVGDFLPRAAEVRLDGRVLAFTAGIAAATGLLFGLAPALQSSRPDLQTPLRDSARATSRRGHAARSALVVAQVALALVMLVSAGLIVRSFANLRRVDLGFDPRGVTTATVALSGSGYRTRADVLAFLRQAEERLPAITGATSTGFTSVLPLNPGGDSDMHFTIVGKPERLPDGRRMVSWYRSVAAGYFEAMKMRMSRGRPLARGAHEAVVNETFAARYFPGEDPIGRQVIADGPPLTIVGIVADARTQGPRAAARSELFLPYPFMPEGTYSLVVRGADPAVTIPAIRAMVAAIDPRVPVRSPAAMLDLHAASLAQPRLLATLLGAFAGAALLLAVLGIYGVMSYAAGQRATEMGVRLALGATPRQVVALVLGDGLKLALVGLAIGAVASYAAAGAIGTLLHGVAPRDAGTFAAAGAAIILTAVAASWFPARRASKIAPSHALRA